MRAVRWIAIVAATFGAVAALAPPAGAADSSPHCTAYGSLPARVSMHRDQVVVHTVLRGSAACHGAMTDNGASAYLHRPGHPDEKLRWRKFGSSLRVDLYINLDRAGRYTLNSGDVQVYDDKYRHVPSSWRSTTMIVKHAARFIHLTTGGSAVSGRVQQYSKFGWTDYSGAQVYVQRRVAGSSQWRTLGSTHADAQGRVAFSTATSANHFYRLSVHQASSVWGAQSKGERG
jgi:hypothetical protein